MLVLLWLIIIEGPEFILTFYPDLNKHLKKYAFKKVCASITNVQGMKGMPFMIYVDASVSKREIGLLGAERLPLVQKEQGPNFNY